MKGLSALSLATAAVVVASNLVMFMWVLDLRRDKNNCKCAGSWRRDVLLWTIPASVLLLGLTTFMPFVVVRCAKTVKTGTKACRVLLRRAWFVLLYDFVSVFNLVTVFMYATDLSRASCDCSAGWRRTFATGWPLTVLFLWVLSVLLTIPFAYSMYREMEAMKAEAAAASAPGGRKGRKASASGGKKKASSGAGKKAK